MIIVFEPYKTGHRQEFLQHLVDYIITNRLREKFVFVVHPDIQLQVASYRLHENYLNLQPATCNITPKELNHLKTSNPIIRSFRYFALARKYAISLEASHLIFLTLNDVQLALGVLTFPCAVSGILFKPFARQSKDSVFEWIKWQRKWLQTWFFVRRKFVKKVFLLNDAFSSDFFNQTFSGSKFRMIPDPLPEWKPEPGYDVRKQFGISADRKLFLHIGSLLKRKGTLEIIDSIQYLSESELAQIAILIIGHANPQMDLEIRNRLTHNTQLITDNRKPVTINLQPATCNLQPATCIRYHNTFLPPSHFASCIRQCDLVLAPYRYTESSSGIGGHAIAAGKPILMVKEGFPGEMLATYGEGIFIDTCDAVSIAGGIKKALNTEIKAKISPEYIETHAPDSFATGIFADMIR